MSTRKRMMILPAFLAVTVAAGMYHSLALKADGSIVPGVVTAISSVKHLPEITMLQSRLEHITTWLLRPNETN